MYENVRNITPLHPSHHSHTRCLPPRQATDEHVTIVPNFNSAELHFLNGDFGPFHSNLATSVPLWLALALKERHKCRIEAPEWMSVDALKQALDLEKRMPIELSQSMPFHYVEIAHVLFNKASDNMPEADRVRMLIEDIQDVRMSKLRTGVNELLKNAVTEGTITGAKMTGASHMELDTIRRMYVPFCLSVCLSAATLSHIALYLWC
jgi:GINS complex subunit 2